MATPNVISDPQQVELLSLTDGLGAFRDVGMGNGEVKKTYVKGDRCVECLSKITRLLRREVRQNSGSYRGVDNNGLRPVFKLLCTWNILSTDLLPLLTTYRADPEIVLSTSKLLSFLLLSLSFFFSICIFVVFDESSKAL